MRDQPGHNFIPWRGFYVKRGISARALRSSPASRAIPPG
jgi:hypothetical protein